MSDKIHIVIVDDHPLFREGVAHTLQAEPDLEVVGQGATAEDALRLVRDHLPDILLLDIGIPGGGLHAARNVGAAYPVTRIVMLTVSAEEDDVLAAFKAGARAYVLKGVSARELVSILRAVSGGEVYVTPTLAANLLREMTSSSSGTRQAIAPFDELSERELQVLELVAAGQSNKEIGQHLHLSEKTVKHYMTNILQKLQVRNRVEAAMLAQRVARRDPRA